MNDRNCKNYSTDNGDTLVIGGTLKIENGATVDGVITAEVIDALDSTETGKALSAKQGKVLKDALDALDTTVDGIDDRVAAVQADSTASTVAGVKDDLNALLAKLKAAGLMASS